MMPKFNNSLIIKDFCIQNITSEQSLIIGTFFITCVLNRFQQLKMNKKHHQGGGKMKKLNDNYKNKGYEKTIITKADEFLEKAENDEGIKLVKNQFQNCKGLVVFDASLSARGPIEDRIFSDFPFYRNNIRRGMSLGRFQGKAYWLRKGLGKFFDVNLPALKGEAKGDNEHHATFREIENALSLNSNYKDEQEMAHVNVYKLLKANGENAQVSFFLPTNSWIVASKNVCVPLRNRDDLTNFTEQRYKFAKLIAEAWLDILENLKLSAEQLAALKQVLHAHTLVGEYCGNPEYQHIVKYHGTTILFYAVVEKQGRDTCIPHFQASRIFEEFKLPIVKDYFNKEVGRFNDYETMCQFLVKLFQHVAGGKIEDEEEGCVLYFELEVPEKFYTEAKENGLEDRFYIPDKLEKVNTRVVSLSKLKTLEYRIWRKLREKLKNLYSVDPLQDKADTLKHFSKTYAKLEYETNDLVGTQKLQKPVEYYFYISLLAYKYVLTYHNVPKAFETAQEHYVDFLNILFFCAQNDEQPIPKLMNDKELIMKLREVSWATYDTNKREQYEQLIVKMFPDYVKIKALRKEEPKKVEDWNDEEEKDEKD